MKRERLDPYWHKSRVDARIISKRRADGPLNARDRRLAGAFSEDRFAGSNSIEPSGRSFSAKFRRGDDWRHTTITRVLWNELWKQDIDVRCEIIAAALARRRTGYEPDLPRRDYRAELRRRAER